MKPSRAYADRLSLQGCASQSEAPVLGSGCTARSRSEVHASMSLRADAQTDVRRVRDQFLCEASLEAETLPPSVLDSWRRSQLLDLDPDRVALPYVREPDRGSRLARAAAPVLQRVAD